MVDITVPTLGESVSEATVGRWFKTQGEAVEKDEVLVELETDKVAVEVSATEAGTLSEIVAGEGVTVEIGALLGKIGGANGKTATRSAKAPAPVDPVVAAPSAADGALVDVEVPSMGESVAEGTIASFLKQAGDSVSKDEIIAEIETDKVALEVPASADGVIQAWLVSEGDAVTPGSVVAQISAGAAAPAQKAQPTSAPVVVAASAGTERPVSPAVRRVTTEAGVNPANIPGSGRDGRVTKADAMSYVNHPTTAAPSVQQDARPPRELGPREERVRMTRLRQTIARRLKEAQDTAAMLTTFNDVDMSAVMSLRKLYKDAFLAKHGVKLGFMGFFTKAVVSALQEIPAVNAEIDGTDIIYKNHYDMGIAVGTEKGLVVPVVRDCDELSIAGIEREIGEMGKKARDGNLSIADMQGGTFTITNGGVYGSLMSTPILNPPDRKSVV